MPPDADGLPIELKPKSRAAQVSVAPSQTSATELRIGRFGMKQPEWLPRTDHLSPLSARNRIPTIEPYESFIGIAQARCSGDQQTSSDRRE